MGILDWIGIGKEIAQPIEAVSKLYTTDKERLEAENKYQEIVNKTIQSQLTNNRLMILSGKFFLSAWPALIGWTAGFLVLIYYAPQIFITTYVWAKICISQGIINKYPMKSDDILNLVWLLFGFGAYNIADRKINR